MGAKKQANTLEARSVRKRFRFSIRFLLLVTFLVATALWVSKTQITVVQISSNDLSLRYLKGTGFLGFGRDANSFTVTEHSSTDLSQFLSDRGWAMPGQFPEDMSYYTVKHLDSHGRYGRGPAHLLYRNLYSAGSGRFWIKWSEKNPKLADKHWRAFFQLLTSSRRSDRYGKTILLLGGIKEREARLLSLPKT